MDGLDEIKDIAEKHQQVKLGSGVMGKTGTAFCALVPVWMIVVWRLGENTFMNISLITAGGAITAVAIWWIRRLLRFAEKNPGAALLEGAEFVAYQRWEAEVKGLRLSRGKVIPDPHALPDRSGGDER